MWRPVPLLLKLSPVGVQVNSGTAPHTGMQEFVKWMADDESRVFSLLEWEVPDKLGEEASMNHKKQWIRTGDISVNSN